MRKEKKRKTRRKQTKKRGIAKNLDLEEFGYLSRYFPRAKRNSLHMFLFIFSLIPSNATLIYQKMARMIYRTLRVIHEYSI